MQKYKLKIGLVGQIGTKDLAKLQHHIRRVFSLILKHYRKYMSLEISFVPIDKEIRVTLLSGSDKEIIEVAEKFLDRHSGLYARALLLIHTGAVSGVKSEQLWIEGVNCGRGFHGKGGYVRFDLYKRIVFYAIVHELGHAFIFNPVHCKSRRCVMYGKYRTTEENWSEFCSSCKKKLEKTIGPLIIS